MLVYIDTASHVPILQSIGLKSRLSSSCWRLAESRMYDGILCRMDCR